MFILSDYIILIAGYSGLLVNLLLLNAPLFISYRDAFKLVGFMILMILGMFFIISNHTLVTLSAMWLVPFLLTLPHCYFAYRRLNNLFAAAIIIAINFLTIILSFSLSLDFIKVKIMTFAGLWEEKYFLLLSISFIIIIIAIDLLLLYLNKKFHWIDILVNNKQSRLTQLSVIIVIPALFIINTIRLVFFGDNRLLFAIFGLINSIFFVILLLFLIQLTKTARDYQFLTQHLAYLEEQHRKTEFALDFIHDFEALLLTIQIHAEKGDLVKVKEMTTNLHTYIKSHTPDQQFTEVQQIYLPSVQSSIMYYLSRAREKNIHIELDIPYPVERTIINTIDFLRVLSILFNNAIEATEHAENPTIKLRLAAQPDALEVNLTNSTSDTHILQTSQLVQKGRTSKKGHQGRGLYIFQKIAHKYSNVDYTISNEEKSFSVSLIISK
ncbi:MULTISPECIES: GHKL domain-containing protein [Listeria]|uniref:GHKL domain-containing protein n=1 Tax=Listeria TaxID=1637 RepID=UPI000B58E0A9|nr:MULTISPECIES: GHKL domain-containing protein [Listeria]